MAMQQCPNGHLYDDAKNGSCPYCSNGNTIGVTVPLSDSQASAVESMFPKTTPLDGFGTPEYAIPQPQVQSEIPPTVAVNTAMGVTKYLDQDSDGNGIMPIRGWLVCLEGNNRGEDFKIHGEKNTIGRGLSNDIKLDFDSSISKGVNAIISYDVRNNKFYIFLGESKNNIYVNNSLLMTPIELKDYDIIEIGETKMIFRSFCNEAFTWESSDKEEKE